MKKRAKWIWGGIVCAFLFGSVGLQATLITMAISDPSFAEVPDYERRANEWDAIQAERRASEALGWTVDLRLRSTGQPGEAVVEVQLYGRFGKPKREADVQISAFHLARAEDVRSGSAAMVGDGLYQVVLPAERSGVWEVELEVDAGDERYVGTFRRRIVIPPPAG